MAVPEKMEFKLDSREARDIFVAFKIALAMEERVNDPLYAEFCKRLRKLNTELADIIADTIADSLHNIFNR